MTGLHAFFDDSRWPMAFVLLIVTITVASLVAHWGRASRQRATGSARPWPGTGALTLTPTTAHLVDRVPTQQSAAQPTPPPTPPRIPQQIPLPAEPIEPIEPAAPAVPEPRTPLAAPEALPAEPPAEPPVEPPDPPGPVGTVLLVLSPDGFVQSTTAAQLLGLEPGVQARVRRIDIDADALVAALPDDVAILLDDLTAAPTDTVRNYQFRRAVDAGRPRVPCAVVLAGPPGLAPAVAVCSVALRPLIARDPQLAARLAMAVTPVARPDAVRLFDTALLAAARAVPADTLLDLDGLETGDPWLAGHGADLLLRYQPLLCSGSPRPSA